MAESHIIARVHPSMLDLPAEPWNALLAQQTHATPFMRHEYLAALERSGSATPRPGGKAVFDVRLRFAGSACALGDGATANGIAHVSTANGELFVLAMNAAKTDGWLYLGARSAD